MRLIAKVKCPGCKIGDTQVRFVAPGFMSTTQQNFTCDICESVVFVKFARKDNKNFKDKGSQVQIGSRILIASPKLVALIEEERQLKAQTQDEQSQPNV